MKTNILFDRIEAISYFCHILLPLFFKNKICRIHKFRMENKKLNLYLPQTPITKYIKLPVILENNKIAGKNTHLLSHVSFHLKKKH